MKTTTLLVLFLPLLLFPAGETAAQIVPGVSSERIRAGRQAFTAEVLRSVNEATSEWKRAWERGEPDDLLDFYTNDAILTLPGGQRLVGRDRIEDALRADLLPSRGTMVTRQLDLVASGRMAVSSGRFRTELQREGRFEQTSGSYITVFLRDGRHWEIRSQFFHEDGLGISGSDELP